MGIIMVIISYVAFCILINAYDARGILDLKQSGLLYACYEGAMSVTCSTSAEILRWNVTLLHSDSLHSQRTFVRDLSYIGTANMTTPILTAMTTLNVSRSLNSSSPLPLISTISTDNTTTDLNGTVITCSGTSITSSKVLASNSVEVFLIGNSTGNVSINITPILNISDQFGPNSVTVTLVWSHKNGVSYSVSVNPQTMDVINYTGKNSAQLMLSYDTKYNISVVASLCEHNSITLRVINYVTCDQLASESDKSVSHRNPALVGTVATISCRPGMVLTGSNVTTCMENRKWYPDPHSAMCKADCSTPVVNSNISLNYSSTLEDSLLTFQCRDGFLPGDVFTARCYRNGSWIPNPFSYVCATSLEANCGDPSPPSGGYIEPYTRTTEGTRVNIVHVCQNGQRLIEESICTLEGYWESINGNSCPVNLLAIISGSLGSLLAVAFFVCGILIVVIAVVTRKKAVSSSAHRVRQPPEHHAFEEEGQVDMSQFDSGSWPFNYQDNPMHSEQGQYPEYEEVMASRNETAHDNPEELEMMQNVAYGPLQLR